MGTAKSPITTNILDLLTSQHAAVDGLIDRIESGRGDVAVAFQELADLLAAHAAVEEKIFYPSIMMKQTSVLLHESVEDHLEIKRTLAELMMLPVDSDAFAARLALLRVLVTHHAHHEEESKLFPMLRRFVSPDELEAIGDQVLMMFAELLPNHPSRNLRNETAQAAWLPQR